MSDMIWAAIFMLSSIVMCDGYQRKVLLVSLDGFRWDYMDRMDTPNLDRIAREGVRSPRGLKSAFITKTFPCHYTMVTGLYAESHGIISSQMYDPVFNETFDQGTKDTKWWEGGEPVWITAKLQGLKTATYFWVGSETEIKNTRPDIWMPYARTTPFSARVDTVVDWFNNSDVDFATLYFHEPDRTGHYFGPESEELKDKVKEMDGVVGSLLEKMENEKLLDKVNVIVTSDHGMTEINVTHKIILLMDYISDENSFDLIDSVGTVANIRPRPGHKASVYGKLKDAHPNMTVYLKADIPEFYHYKKNRRVMDIFAIADEGWTISKDVPRQTTGRGNHGYDNRLQSMYPFFLARGPNFKVNYTTESFENVNLYRLICELLEIDPAPNNGSLSNVKHIIRGSPTNVGTCAFKCSTCVLLVSVWILSL